MASVKLTGFEDLANMFKMISDPTEMAIQAVNEAAPVLEKQLKAEITAAAEHPTGGLAGSITTTPAKENDLGVYSVVKPEGTDKNGVDYVDRMRYFDVGFHDKGKEWHQGHGVRQKAVNSARSECEKILEKNVEKFIDKATGG